MYKAGQLVTIEDSLCRIEKIPNTFMLHPECDFRGQGSSECNFCRNKLSWNLRLKLVTKLRKKPQ